MNKIEDYKRLFEELYLDELSVKDGDFSITMKAGEGSRKNKSHIDMPVSASDEKGNEKSDEYYKVESPVLGVFYAGEAPDAKPYVSVGDKVKKGDILCTIEAMKMFNEVRSTVDGVVREILVNNGELVEFHKPMFGIELEAC